MGLEVHLGLHLFGRGDVVLPVPAHYDPEREAYLAEITVDAGINSLFPDGKGAYDAISLYDHTGRRLSLLSTSATRGLMAGDIVSVQVESDEYR